MPCSLFSVSMFQGAERVERLGAETLGDSGSDSASAPGAAREAVLSERLAMALWARCRGWLGPFHAPVRRVWRFS